ncbi:MAG: gliding motility lipoprotein GldH [Flavobacteriaceae bacterium]|nr:gliding motility lipoprotein GldH [Flavobacteriaceae bacterium]
MLKKTLVIALLVALASCNENVVHSEYVALSNGMWREKDTVRFELPSLDSTVTHDLFLNVRNDDRYAFSNLFLITEFDFPNGETLIDTLEYEMALPDGSWLGKGMGSVKESKLWLKEKIVFADSGVYTLKVSHAMRKNGEVEGIENLEGITDIGIAIEKSK